MTWDLKAGIWLMMDGDREVDFLQHDGEQYRSKTGLPMGRNFTEAQRALVAEEKKREKKAAKA